MRFPFGVGFILRRAHNQASSKSSKDRWRTIKLGDVSAKLPEPRDPKKVPVKYLSENETPRTWGLLRWLLQKDHLGQDVFLLAPPGSERRRLVFKYLEFTGREVEYVALSADTTDSDLKQYRELSGNQAGWRDQAAVRAATEGRVLVLDGVERAERNLLPLINNLLENREMHLDDGGFLLKAEKFDELLQEVGPEKLAEWGMRRVDEQFRVIALGAPVPPFKGNTLDPPFRSRFQCKSLKFPDYDDALSELRELAPTRGNHLEKFLNIVYTINSPQVRDLGLPFFNFDSASKMAQLWEKGVPFGAALDVVYPSFHLTEDAQRVLADLISKEGMGAESSSYPPSSGKVTLNDEKTSKSNLILTSTFERAVSTLCKALSVGDVCIIGSRGCGKNTLAHFAAAHLGFDDSAIVHIPLYKDMSARELLQSRRLDEGTTVWRDSPIVKAALEGNCLILDGVDVLDPTVLSSLQSLIHERELWLSDSSTLLRQDRWEALGKPDGMRPVHPNFKIIALAEPPKKDSTDRTWLSPEVSSMFMSLHLPPLPVAEQREVLSKLVGKSPPQELFDVISAFRKSSDAPLRSLAESLSTRQLLRLCRKLNAYPDSNLYDLLSEATLIKFAPQLTRIAFDETLAKCGVEADGAGSSNKIEMKIERDTVTIGDVVLIRNLDNESPAKIPSTLFFENARQLEQLHRISQDLVLGEHLLLVGNQGVGKNKIIDYLLGVCNQPREYMQLHRDTTVASLSVQPQLIDGSIVYQNSPLMNALTEGRIVVIDEADKAPVQVTRVLHSLLARGEMLLADGRRVLRKRKEECGPLEIPIHPKFQAILLANRPGFPFMGNDFFPLVGDALSVHSIDAPDAASERTLLSNYAPNLPEETLAQLVDLFADLRKLYDSGQIGYPFSTRELVSVTKHLAAFPDDGILQALNNVLDFDSHEPNSRRLIGHVVRSYGISFDADASDVFLGESRDLGKWSQLTSFPLTWQSTSKVGVEEKQFKFIDQLFLREGYRVNSASNFPRIDKFTELGQQWSVPLSRVKDLVISGGIPHIVSYEGKPVVAALDETSRTWLVSELPLRCRGAAALGLKTSKPGNFCLVDRDTGHLYVTNLEQNVMNLSNIPPGEILYRDSDVVLIKTNPKKCCVLSLDHSLDRFTEIYFDKGITQAVPFGDHILINKSLLVNLRDGSSNDAQLQDGLRFVDRNTFVSDLHTIGRVKFSEDKAELSGIARATYEVCEDSVALKGGVIASTMNSNPYCLEYVNVNEMKVARQPLLQKNILLRSCDTVPGRLFSLERAKSGWNLNVFTLGTAKLIEELREWQKTLGSDPRFQPSGPKHGKTDDKEHHGGNTWAGGTGGSDTAGLGGVGGPYRLDKGFDVHQVSDEVKRAVPPHIAERARKMAKEALARRLKEIQMSDSEHNTYRSYLDSVKNSVQALRVVLEGLEGNKQEREWVRHRAEGDVDETKLVEAAAGEKNIFKRRMVPEHKNRGRQEKPKRLVLLVDVSGSMYRFNGYDARLEREMEAVIMMMDALHGFKHKIHYEIRGHSGEESSLPLVKLGEPPEDEKERFRILQRMYAHAQYCMSGDSTLQAMKEAVEGLKNCEDYDENCVILLSDANLERYGISGRALAREMTSRQPEVQAYTVLIGSLGAQAQYLKKSLPPGHGFVCMDTKELPQILKQIFSAKLVN
ncbi:von Willebrand factor A domain-containing protein 8 [Galendromus occidentalis]|uniref:von Willebrand factor A domain-containing protein 8 n=1 Tax=Galendromus occidentalis TaxID=34638 RepID=A0AAJ7WHF4_9ACAR|nr:von Willebrand factor A domain-containing protein 8 [Galendromus occidentalis]